MNVIGRMCIVQDLRYKTPVFVEGLVIDRNPVTQLAKRVRLQTGEHFGEVRQPGEYNLVEFVTPGEAPSALAAVWPSE